MLTILYLILASLEPKYENDLKILTGTNFSVIRMPTIRPNISYNVQDVSDINTAILETIGCFLENSETEQRALVYCLTHNEVMETSAYLQQNGVVCSYLHSELEGIVKYQQLDMWLDGRARVMCATCVIGCGYNVSHLPLVIHKGIFRSLADFHQETGRGGRDGRPSFSHVITNGSYRKIALDISADMQVCNDWIENHSSCRRHELHQVVDGQAVVCFLIPGASLCDICARTTSAATQELGLFGRMRPILNTTLMLKDIEDVKLIRNYMANIGSKCLICYVNLSVSLNHSIERCPLLIEKRLCLQCFGDHFVRECKNKIPFNSDICSRCHFSHKPIQDFNVHQDRWGRDCTDNLGERLRTLLWTRWRVPEHRSELVRHLPQLQQLHSEPDLAKWLSQFSNENFVNNFVKIAAVMIRLLNQRFS